MYLTTWAEEIKSKYKAGISNCFIVTGNIRDYAYELVKMDDYISEFITKELGINSVKKFDKTGSVTILNEPTVNQNKNTSTNYNFSKVCEELLGMENQKMSLCYILDYPEYLFPASDYKQPDDIERIINFDKLVNSSFATSSNLVIILTETVSSISEKIRNSDKTTLVQIPLPTYQEREMFLNVALHDRSDFQEDKKLEFIRNQIDTKQFTQLTAGLTLFNIEDIILLAKQNKHIDTDMVLRRKEELIRKGFGDIIELINPRKTSFADFSGKEKIKQYFQETVIDSVKTGDIEGVPKGVLFVGPPGTGKTYFSICLAGSAGINCIEFKMSKILDKYVGVAEQRLEKAFQVFKALAPVIVFIDEADQALSRGTNDSNQVSKNIFGAFLSEMSKNENRGKIIWIGATNYPNLMDEALKRPGRFDKKIPFFAPNQLERMKAFEIHLNKTNKELVNIDYEKLGEISIGYTQAEIEGIIVKTEELVKRRKLDSISMELLEEAKGFLVNTSNKKIQEMEDIALMELNDLEFLPEEYLERYKTLKEKKGL